MASQTKDKNNKKGLEGGFRDLVLPSDFIYNRTQPHAVRQGFLSGCFYTSRAEPQSPGARDLKV